MKHQTKRTEDGFDVTLYILEGDSMDEFDRLRDLWLEGRVLERDEVLKYELCPPSHGAWISGTQMDSRPRLLVAMFNFKLVRRVFPASDNIPGRPL